METREKPTDSDHPASRFNTVRFPFLTIEYAGFKRAVKATVPLQSLFGLQESSDSAAGSLTTIVHTRQEGRGELCPASKC
jgi:hypothetical protein